MQGKPAVAVRAFLPRTQNAWVVRGPGGRGCSHAAHSCGRIFRSGLSPASRRFSLIACAPNMPGSTSLRIPTGSRPSSRISICTCWPRERTTKLTKNWARTSRKSTGVRGVSFAVWAPNAQRVSVVGNFNQWDGRQHPMRVRGATGVWEIFIPGLREGEVYKFEIKGRHQELPGIENRSLWFLLGAAPQDRLDCL